MMNNMRVALVSFQLTRLLEMPERHNAVAIGRKYISVCKCVHNIIGIDFGICHKWLQKKLGHPTNNLLQIVNL